MTFLSIIMILQGLADGRTYGNGKAHKKSNASYVCKMMV
jgi:hypothetical protein